MTREEEDLLLAEIQAQNRPRAASNVSSEWDGNPPAFYADWANNTTSWAPSGMTHSSSANSLGSEGAMSPRKQGGLSPSSSNAHGQPLGGGTSIMDRTFTRSYGFTGAASFRDNNYLRSVEKEKSKGRGHSPQGSPSGLWEEPYDRSPSYRGKALPSIPNMRPLMSPDASQNTSSASLHPDSAKGTYSPSTGSERTVTPTPSVNNSVSYAAWKIPQRKNNPPERPQPEPPVEEIVDEPPTVNVEVEGAPRSLPLNDTVGTTSTLRQKPVDPRRGQRQSLLMGLSPTQAKRISVALLEIETHLRRSSMMGGDAYGDDQRGSYERGDDDQEEMLDGEEEEEDDPDTSSHAHPYEAERERERRPSASSTGGASSVFPFTASPASSARTAFASSQTDITTTAPRGNVSASPTSPPRLPSLHTSSHNLNLESQFGSPTSSVASPTSHLASPPQQHATRLASPPHFGSPHQQQASQFASPPRQSVSQFASPSSQTTSPARQPTGLGHASSHSIASTTYSEDNYSQPALVPTRPQPARYTPSPAPGVSSSYVPGQPRPVGSMRKASQSSVASTAASPPTNSTSPGHVDSLTKRLQYPAVPGARAAQMPSLSRSLSAQQDSSTNSRSQTPTQLALGHVPAPGILASRHQASHSLSETSNGSAWRTGSSLAMHSPPSQTTINEEEQRPESHNRSNSTAESLSTRSREHSPLLFKKNRSPAVTNSPSLQSLNSERRPESIASVSSTWSGPNPGAECLWTQVLNDASAQQEPQPVAEEDSTDLELLKSMSGMGKEELSVIQDRLVEKAKTERDRLRAEGETTPVTSPSVTHANMPSTPPSYLAYLPSPERGSPSSGHKDPQSPLAALAMLPGHLPGLPPQPVDPSELPQGPPPPRPQHPSEVTGQRSQAPTPPPPSSQTASPTKTGHGRADSKPRVWLDDDPDAKRDIEKRIATATSNLFRAPSRNAHKRSLSKSARKQISSPTLVSYSATVPTVPIANLEDSTHKRNKSGEEKKGPTHKLSLRWKRKGKKSTEGTPPPPSALPAAFATPTTQPSSTSTPASTTSNTKSVTSPTPAPRKTSDAAEKEREKEREKEKEKEKGADLNGFRFPNSSTTSVPAGTRSRGPSASGQNPLSSQASSPVQATSGLPTVAQVVELSKKTHRPTGSEDSVAIARFYEAGRAVGLSEGQLHDMLQQNATLNRSGTTTSTRSHGSTAPTSHGQSPPPTSPTGGVVHLGNGVKLQPPAALARIPTPVVEQHDASSIHSVSASNDVAASPEPEEPVVVHHTIVMADALPPHMRPSTPPRQPGLMMPERPDKSPKRSNSIRRKPVQITETDRELINRSPLSAASNYPASQASPRPTSQAISHHRNLSELSATSEQWALPPRQFADGAHEGMPNSAGSQYSMGLRNSSTQGSIYDYYGGEGMSPDRTSGYNPRGSGIGSIGARDSGFGYRAQDRDSGYDYAPPPRLRDSGYAGARNSVRESGMERGSQAVEIT